MLKLVEGVPHGPGLRDACLTLAPELAALFAQSTAHFPRWQAALSAAPDRAAFIAREFAVLVDYLALASGDNASAYLDLFIGERVKAFHDASLSDEQRGVLIAKACQAELDGVAALASKVPAPVAQALSATLSAVHEVLSRPSAKARKVLLVGDCLFLDVVSFITAPLARAGLAVDFEYITSKNPVELRRQLKALDPSRFDLVFFSPFSYEFLLGTQSLLNWRNAAWRSARREQELLALAKSAESVLEALCQRFECPVIVHNHSGVLREERTWARHIKLWLTHRLRGHAVRLLNHMLTAAVERINRSTYKHAHVLDERALVLKAGLAQAGAYLHKSELQHPAVLGQLLAPAYLDLMRAHFGLVGKKLVVCDLDNTVWDGVIGEGAVSHFHDRQATLKRLKARGVVLAILSKNDPANVHWRGGTLQDEDFVYASVSWDPKVQGMRRIEQHLNMKIKDFVFIDDRHDEREMMSATYPQVTVLDATDAAVWRQMACWADALDEEQGADRTLMYKQREARMAFTGAEEGEAQANADLFATLDLKVRVAQAGQGDLKRVAELINRTNQFNLEGSRTTFQEVSAWHASAQHMIWTGHSSDRFGDMGVTCVAAMALEGQVARLLPFVLSCRVFGYGIELAVLNTMKREAIRRGATQMVGRFVQTPQNAPCRDFLPGNGFVRSDSDAWVCDLSAPLPDTPVWLKVLENK